MGRYATQFYAWRGVVLILGPLPLAWGGDSTRAYRRDTVRAAQEMGINLLHFAWQQRQLTQLQQPAVPPDLSPS